MAAITRTSSLIRPTLLRSLSRESTPTSSTKAAALQTARKLQNTNSTRTILVQSENRFSSYTEQLVDITKKHKREAKILINKINFSNLWRSQAKSQILTEGAVRLDLQGFSSNGSYNYQLQVGSHTIATVIIDKGLAGMKTSHEQTYAMRKIKSGFQQSLGDSRVYRIDLSTDELPYLRDQRKN